MYSHVKKLLDQGHYMCHLSEIILYKLIIDVTKGSNDYTA
jgi:hypothetical protein